MTTDRFRGCLVGLAVGDVLGGQLTRSGDPFHAALVAEVSVPAGDATELAMAAGRGILAGLENGREPEQIADAVAQELTRWWTATGAYPHDPTTSAAVARRLQGLSTVAAADPVACPAVVAVRAVPFGLAWPAAEVLGPVIAATRLTHSSPTAMEAAAFTAWLVSRIARGSVLDRTLVSEGRQIVGDARLGGSLTEAIADALTLHARLADRPRQWLPIDEIRPGDGQSVESVVGLALVAALLATDGDLEAAIELGTRIHGDSACVGALIGAFIGAGQGSPGVPVELVEPLVAFEVLVGLANALHDGAPDLAVEPRAITPPIPHARRVWRNHTGRGRGTDREWLDGVAIDEAQSDARSSLERLPKPAVHANPVSERQTLVDTWHLPWWRQRPGENRKG